MHGQHPTEPALVAPHLAKTASPAVPASPAWLAGVHQPLQLQPVNAGVLRVLAASGAHVGNLKLVAGCWKFKAVGWLPGGEVEPGGGPFTHRHNTVLARPDAAELTAALGPMPPPPPG